MALRKFTIAACIVFALFAVITVKGEDAPVAAESESKSKKYANDGAWIDTEDTEHDPNFKPTKEQLTEMVRICDQMKDHMHYLNARWVTTPEAKVWHRAADLSKHLDDMKHEVIKKEHHEFTCEEAKQVIDHSTANAFQTQFDDLITGEGEVRPSNLPINLLLENVDLLRHELVSAGLVNHEVEEDLKDMHSDLKFIQDTQKVLRANFEAVKEQNSNCQISFVDYVKTLHSLAVHHLPDWATIHEGIKSIIQQCEADPFVSGKEEL